MNRQFKKYHLHLTVRDERFYEQQDYKCLEVESLRSACRAVAFFREGEKD